MKESQEVKTLMFIEHGMAEVYTECEGNEFIIDRLYEGSIINYRTFIMEDIMSVNIRAVENVSMLELNHTAFDKMLDEFEGFRKKIMIFQNTMLKKGVRYPLDYIVDVPDLRRHRNMSKEENIKFLYRRNKLKNVVFRRIVEIRDYKKKPKLHEVIETYTKQFGNIENSKDFIAEKIRQLYEKDDAHEEVGRPVHVESVKYEKIMSSFDRITKVLTTNDETMNALNRNMAKLLRRRQEREMNGKDIRQLFEKKLEEQKKTAPLIERLFTQYKNEREEQF